mmetsp:Transcript_11518/g.19484  ORF Transcript_11518/g.19484 Transcript_11518/m.19484 type:complete len:80 (+) Transcript_11518:115-354(+)
MAPDGELYDEVNDDVEVDEGESRYISGDNSKKRYYGNVVSRGTTVIGLLNLDQELQGLQLQGLGPNQQVSLSQLSSLQS